MSTNQFKTSTILDSVLAKTKKTTLNSLTLSKKLKNGCDIL